MRKPIPFTLGALALSLALAGCGRGADDTLADGAVDRTQDGDTRASAEDVGPPSPSSAAASPSAGRTGADASTGGPAAPGSGAPASSGPLLRLANAGMQGAHLVDSGGMALYALEGDRMGSKCVGACLQAWTPVLAGAVQPTAEAGLQGAMVSTIARPDGSRQITYNGLPLYRQAAGPGTGAASAGAGQAGGQGAGHEVRDAHGTWHRVGPDGKHAMAAPGAAGTR